MKFSLRIAGRVTSVQVRDSIASLYCLLMTEKEMSPGQCEGFIQDAVYKIAGTWTGNGRGLGSYVTDKLVESMLEGEDLEEHKRLLKHFEGTS